MVARQGASLALLVIAGCQFSATGAAVSEDAGPIAGETTLVDDTPEDFRAPGAQLTGGVVTARGTIEPEAYVLGGLAARAVDGNLLDDDDTWDDAVAEASTRTAFGAGYRQLFANWATTAANRPRGLGIPAPGNYTIFYEGELLLPAGAVTLAANGDDRAVVQVMLDGETWGARLFSRDDVGTIALDVPAAGWYPIRAVLSQGGGDAALALTVTPQFGAAIPVTAERLRARVTTTPGLIAFAFGRALATPLGESAVRTPTATWGTAAPALDLGVPADDFTLRFAGQVLIDEEGTYTLAVDVGPDATDGFRLWVDGEVVAARWTSLSAPAVATLDLSPGWHDLLLDYAEDAGAASLALRLAGPGIPDGPIAPERLRPAVAFGLTASHVGTTPTRIVDATAGGASPTVVQTPLTPPAGVSFAGATIDAVDLGLGLRSVRMSDLVGQVLDCTGSSTLTLPAQPGYVYLAARTGCAGTPVMPPPTWGYRVVDSVIGNDPAFAGQTPELYLPLLVATYHGGERRPFAPGITYTSRPRAITGATRWGLVEVTADLRGAALTVELRTADDEDSLAAAAWNVVPPGELPRGRPGDVVQYRLTIASTGWELPSIDRVAITYGVDAP